jgi:dTDP-4-dehydrorhamnose reductase
MKVLVTGRHGQLARSLAERAEARPGIEIFLAGRPELDLETPGSAAAIVRSLAPQVVINAAAYTAVDRAEDEPEGAFRINAEAAGEIAAAAAEVDARIIQVSTDYVFDGRASEPYQEEMPTNPLGVYGRSKLQGEDLVRLNNADHLIVRTAWVYSRFGSNFLKTMMKLAETKDEVPVVEDQAGCPTSALDLADGLLTVIEAWRTGRKAGLGETYHLAGSGSTSWCGFAEAIFAECRRSGLPSAAVRSIATAEWPTRAVRPANSRLDCRKFESHFGFRMPDWKEACARTIADLQCA